MSNLDYSSSFLIVLHILIQTDEPLQPKHLRKSLK